MNGKRLLIFSTYYWPELAGNAPYATGVAEGLAARGHDVTVVAGYPHYPAWRRAGRFHLASNARRHGVQVRRRWHYVPRGHNAPRRALYEATLTAGGLTAIGWRAPDAVIGIVPSFSGAVLAATAATLFRRPLVLVFQDLMGRAAEQSGYAGGQRVAGVLAYAELAIARRAAAIGVITPGFREYLASGGVEAGRVWRVRNWQAGAPPRICPRTMRARLGWKRDELVCLHAGNMGQKQGLSNLVETARALKGTGIRIVLAGDGNDRPRLEREAAALPTISFLPPQPPGDYEAMLAAADVLLVNQLPAVSDMALPSKLTAYFAAGKPIVAAVAAGSEAARELNLSGAGVVVAPGEPATLAGALRGLRCQPGKADILGKAGQAYAARTLTPAAALDEYETMILAAIATSRR